MRSGWIRLAVQISLVTCALAAVLLGQQAPADATPGGVIKGRITGPGQPLPRDLRLMVGHENNGGFGRNAVPIAADGSFVTRRLASGKYILELTRTPDDRHPMTFVGFKIVDLGASDMTGVTIEVRRDTAITGRFRMESDDPKAVWPPQIIVNAFLALDGMPLMAGVGAEGAPGGTFVLRNAFGPRVLRCGYTLAPGSRWHPLRVTLDGKDITNVPTDFSTYEGGALEIVFTQRSTGIAGTVTDSHGRQARAPWIIVVAADRASRQPWERTHHIAQGDTMGRFSIPVAAGSYRVTALPQDTPRPWSEGQEGLLKRATGGIVVAVEEGQVKKVSLALQGG